MPKQNTFSQIMENLSGKNRVRLLDILKQHPEYFGYLMENYKRKKEALSMGGHDPAGKIIEEEKARLLELVSKNFNPENDV